MDSQKFPSLLRFALACISLPLSLHRRRPFTSASSRLRPPLALSCSTSCWGLAERGSHLLLWVSIFTTRRVPLLPEVLAGCTQYRQSWEGGWVDYIGVFCKYVKLPSLCKKQNCHVSCRGVKRMSILKAA